MARKMKRVDVPDAPRTERVHHETALTQPWKPLVGTLAPVHCSECNKVLVDPADRALGRHEYRCNLSATPKPPPIGHQAFTYPTLGGNADD
jgi:hypothetical protein